MKPDIHPEYRFVAFRDVSTNFTFVTRSCMTAKDTIDIDGTEYPLVVLDVSSDSHPFYTGTQKIMDTEGRVDRYYRKYGFKREEEEEEAAKAPEE